MIDEPTSPDARYFVLTVDVPAAAADLFSGVLFQLGARGLENVPAEGLMLFPDAAPPPPGVERLRATFVDQGPEVRAALERNVARHLAAVPPELRSASAAIAGVEDVAPADWSKLWRSFFKPQAVGERLFLRPSWEPASAPAGRIALVIDPGQAFGTGGHETTRLCLEWVEARTPGHSLLDLGTGSGILALAAARLGASPVLAVDNDPQAVAVARDNLAANGAADAVELRLAEVDAVEERFERIVANILAPPLIRMAADLAAHLDPGGELALSGILVEQLDRVAAAYGAAGLTLQHRREQGEWGLLHLRRPEP